MQRLRKRLVVESRENVRSSSKQNLETPTGERMGNRVPSFFTSPSLVNLGGLSMGDPYNIQNVANELPSEEREFGARSTSPQVQIEIKPGWSGMGLRGNHSYASLTRPPSFGSGLFLEEESDEERSSGGNQAAGETTVNKSRQTSMDETNGNGPYVKTTSMANFYYRKTKSQENMLGDSGSGSPSTTDNARRTKSDANI